MAYDVNLADRIRKVLDNKNVAYKEQEMFGGIAFMVKGKMCVGVIKNDLMARIDPDIYEKEVKRKGARPMDFAKRPMKGFVYVEPNGVDTIRDLRYWVGLCLDFNPKAPLHKKKKSR